MGSGRRIQLREIIYESIIVEAGQIVVSLTRIACTGHKDSHTRSTGELVGREMAKSILYIPCFESKSIGCLVGCDLTSILKDPYLY